MRYKLIDTGSGKEIKPGYVIKTFRGEDVEVLSFTPPHKPSSTGKVYLRFLTDGWKQEYYPNVVEAQFIKLNDSNDEAITDAFKKALDGTDLDDQDLFAGALT